MLNVTAGMLKAFLQCPLKYHFAYIEHIEIPSDDSYSIMGKKIHALINYKLKGFEMNKLLNVLKSDENKELLRLWTNFISLGINDVFESEYSFNVRLTDEVRLSGRTDAIRKTDDKYEILDWKTGEFYNPDDEMQTIVYLYGIFKVLKSKQYISNPEDLFMTYYFLKNKKNIRINFSNEKLKEYEERLIILTKKIKEETTYTPTDKKKCPKCSYQIICKGTYEGMNDVL